MRKKSISGWGLAALCVGLLLAATATAQINDAKSAAAAQAARTANLTQLSSARSAPAVVNEKEASLPEMKPPEGPSEKELKLMEEFQGKEPPAAEEAALSVLPFVPTDEGATSGELTRDTCVGDYILGTYLGNSYQYPINGYYNYSRTMSLILRSEFTTCTPYKITQLGVNIYTASTMNVTNMTVWMKKTTAATVPTTWDVTGASQVYGPITVNFTPAGWMMFDITDFVWDTDNLLIYWQWNGTYSSSRPYFSYTASFNYGEAYGYSDSGFPTTFTTTSNRPWYTFTFAAPPTIGACCFGYSCVADMSQADCVGGGGTYMGDGSTCTPNPCQAACCYNYPNLLCADVSQAECTALGGNWYLGQSCATFYCPPWNDNCTAVTPVTLTPGTPVTFTGNNLGATNDCASFPGGQVWHAITLPAAESFFDVWLDYCTTNNGGFPFGNAWLNWATGCPCTGITAAGTYDTTTCGDGNLTIKWSGLTSGTYYYPVLLDSANHAAGNYTLHVVCLPGYCSSGATSTADETLKNVTLGTINNTTTDCDTYNDFTYLSTDVIAGQTYPFSIIIGDCEGTSCYSKRLAIFIDLNEDYDFVDSGEWVFNSGQLTNTPCPDFPLSGNILIPLSATLGPTRMRVVVVETSSTDPVPCGTYTWGATEDYTVNILPPPEQGACCFGLTCQEPMTQADCEGAGGVYKGDGTDCDPNPCVGACCFLDGTCLEVFSAGDCAGMGGSYLGDGTSCSPNPCPQPGACCFSDGSCLDVPQDVCTMAGGTFKGVGTTCANTLCPLLLVTFPLDVDPGWTMEAEWQFGPPLGLGTVDPTAAHTGTNVYGYDLTGLGAQLGNYEISQPQYNLTTTAISTVGYMNIELRFWRWLRVESATFDHASIQVSNDLTNWTTVWNHTGSTITDTVWTQFTYPLGATATDQPTVYIRWTMGPTDTSVEYCGWNIDDVEIWGAEIPPVGACCQDGVCVGIMSQAECEALPGVYKGDGTVCTPNPCVGACCFLDGSCQETLSQAECAGLGGNYLGDGTDCDPNPCPQPGNTCAVPKLITLLPGGTLVDTDTTCGRGNDYADTCLGYYDGGEDIIYELTLPYDMCVKISVDGVLTWVGVAIDTVCPPGAACLAYATSSAGDPVISNLSLTAGVYYIMIDTWPSPTCTGFTMTVKDCTCDVACPPGALQEPEACGEDTDGGCNMAVPTFAPIACGDVVCGTMWANTSLRDTDWYQLTTPDWNTFTWTAEAEVPVLIFVIRGAGPNDCSSYAILGSATAQECTPVSITTDCLSPGTYWFWVGPSAFQDYPCVKDYVVSLECATCPPQYCSAGSSYVNCDEYISRVQVGTIDNQTGCSQPGGYGDYTALSTDLAYTVGVPITVTNGHPYSSDQCKVWIDWNQDFDFYDAGEGITMSGSPGNGPYTGTITAPTSALPGPTRMRVRITYTGALDPCGITTYGEVEDYTVNIVEVPGACCWGDGSCTSELPSLCGGYYAGPFTLCAGTDCNQNGADDFCDIASGYSPDCDGNGVPDECQPFEDCNSNGIADFCDLAECDGSPWCSDCNENGILDECDILNGAPDCQGNGIPDECDVATGGPGVLYLYDDGTHENAIGLTNGGYVAWMVHFVAQQGGSTIGKVHIAYGMVTDGTPVTIYVWSDPNQDGNPTDGQVASQAAAVVANSDLDVFNEVDVPDVNIGPAGTHFFAGAIIQHPAGQYPCSLDQTSSAGESWIAGDGTVPIDPNNMGAASLPPLIIDTYFPGNWLVRAESGGGGDCNQNGIPDECDVPPICEGPGCSQDCNADLIPDECQLEGNDCNTNGRPDDCDIASGYSQDCNNNGIPDECDIADGTSQDCQPNGIPDECDIASGTSQDCQPNGIPDECEIAAGSCDCQGDGIPDECQLSTTDRDVVVNEGFEVSVPPSGWTLIATHTGTLTWYQGSYLPYEGLYDAECLYDPALVPQDEWLLTPVMTLFGDVTLTGATEGSVYWGITPYDNYDIQAWIVIGDVGGGDDTMIAKLDNENWVTNWTWAVFSYTFPAPSGPFRLGFRYVGVDGAQGDIDAIQVLGQTGAPPNDCNQNGIPDECDIGTQWGGYCAGPPPCFPPECESDWNSDGVPDSCEPCGDIDNDDDVDIDDYWAFVDAFGTCVGNIKYNPAADMDGDGCITLVDYRAWRMCYLMANGKDFVVPKPKPMPKPAPAKAPKPGVGL